MRMKQYTNTGSPMTQNCIMDAVSQSPNPHGSLNKAEQIKSSAKGALAQPRPKATRPSCGRQCSVS